MFEAIQEIVDRLAAALGRAVVLQDPDFELLSSSKHFGELDAAQIGLLSDRRPGDAVEHLLREARVHGKHDAVLIGADLAHGLTIPRWVQPLRSTSHLYGFLTVLVSTPLAAADELVLSEASHTLLRLLERSARSIADVNAIAESEMLGLIAEDPITRDLAATDLLELGMFNRSRHFVAFHLHVPVYWSPWEAPAMRDLITRLLMRGITTPMIDDYSFVPTSPHSFILIGFQRPPTPDAIAAIGHGIERELAGAIDGIRFEGVLGVGGVVPKLTLAWQSYEQAVAAASVARERGSVTAAWANESVLASLSVLLVTDLAPHMLPEPLRLLDQAEPETLHLLDLYFSHAGSIADVAHELGVHRSTVYQRLTRVTDHLEVDLADGDTRLMLHAWMTLKRRSKATDR